MIHDSQDDRADNHEDEHDRGDADGLLACGPGDIIEFLDAVFKILLDTTHDNGIKYTVKKRAEKYYQNPWLIAS